MAHILLDYGEDERNKIEEVIMGREKAFVVSEIGAMLSRLSDILRYGDVDSEDLLEIADQIYAEERGW